MVVWESCLVKNTMWFQKRLELGETYSQALFGHKIVIKVPNWFGISHKKLWNIEKTSKWFFIKNNQVHKQKSSMTWLDPKYLNEPSQKDTKHFY